jgi:hypothetical protein
MIGASLAAFAVAGCATAQPPEPAVTSSSQAAASSSPAPVPAAVTSSPTPAQAVNAWRQNGGKAALDALAAAETAVTKVPVGDMAGLAAECKSMQDAVTALQAAGPIPYPPAEAWLAKALAEYSAGAADCQAGAAAQSDPLLRQTIAAFDAANADMQKLDTALGGIGA